MESPTGENMVTLTESMERMEARLEAAAALFERTAALLEERESAMSGEVRKIVAAVETSREAELQKKLEAAEQQIAELRAQIESRMAAKRNPQPARRAKPFPLHGAVSGQTGHSLAGVPGGGRPGRGLERAESRAAHRGEGAVTARRCRELSASQFRWNRKPAGSAGFLLPTDFLQRKEAMTANFLDIHSAADYIGPGADRSSPLSDRDRRHRAPPQHVRPAHQTGPGHRPSVALFRADRDPESLDRGLRRSAQHRRACGDAHPRRAQRAAQGHRRAAELQPVRHGTGRAAEAVRLSAGQGPGGHHRRRDARA